MALVQYVRSEELADRSFFDHLAQKMHIRALATITWFVFLFTLAFNGSVAIFSRQSSAQIASVASVSDDSGDVQGVLTSVDPSPAPTSAVTDLGAAEEEQVVEDVKTPRKQSYKIAIIGDSMVDTMGNRLEYLEGALKKRYPSTTFALYNYGIGAENVETGLARFGKSFQNTDRNYPPLNSLGADIIIVGSFAYNPFSPFDRDRHWLTLAKLIEEAKKTGADVYMLADIAPLRFEFGKGPNGVNWDSTTAYEHSGRIIQQEENAIGLSKNLNVILINVFEKSIVNARSEGKKEYVNPSDGIHPSVKGHEFTAEEIANTLVLD